MKKVFFLMTFLCLALMAGAAEPQKVDSLWYSLNGSGDKMFASVIAAPRDKTPYRDLPDWALIIPDSIKVKIDADSILIPVTEIQNNVFEYCSNITSVTVNAKIKKIPQYCFRECTGLTSISFGEEVTTIEIIDNHAFYGCTQLGKIIIPNSVTRINSLAFSGCSKMTEVSIPKSVIYIDGRAFEECSSLTKVDFASLEALLKIDFFVPSSNPLQNAKAQLWINGEKLESLVIPADINGIKKYAFAGLNSVSSVDFSEVTQPLTIENDAFINNSGYDKVIFKDAEQLCSIDYGSWTSNPLFYGKHIYYKDDASEIWQVVIPASSLDEKKIRRYILAGANSVTRIDIPDDAQSIGVGAFKGCSNFEFVAFTLEETFKSISWDDDDANPYANGKAKPLLNGAPLESLTLNADVTAGKYKNSTWLKSVTLTTDVTTIGAEAFMGCTNLASVTFSGAEITSIGDRAFRGCSALEGITLPESVTSIGEEAFRNCENKNFKEFTIPASCESLGQGAFVYCTQLKTITILSSIDIPYLCFQNCGNLQKVITTTTKNIGHDAFYNCANLTEVPVTDELTAIDYNAFYGCKKLTTLMLSERGELATIGKSAFNGCIGVTMVSLPASISEIKENAFSGCTALDDVYCLKETTPVPIIYDNTFGGRESEIRLHVTNTDDYLSNDYWKKFKIVEKKQVALIFYVNDVQYGDTIKAEAGTRITVSEPTVELWDDGITKEEFSGWNKPFPETMPSDTTAYYGYVTTTTTIGNYKYKIYPEEKLNDNNLERRAELIGVVDNSITQSNSKVTVPGSVNNSIGYNQGEFPVIAIGTEAFKGQGELAEITLPTSIKELGESAFMNCGRLESVKGLAESHVRELSENLFLNCTSLSFSEIPANIISIKKWALSNTGCLDITIHKNIQIMGDEVFKNCKYLEKVTFEEGFKLALPQMTFLSCSALKDVNLVGTMASIGIRAFEGCGSLETIVIPDGITAVGRQSFLNCNRLANLTLPLTVTQINEQAFKGCSSLAQIVVEAKTPPAAYANAFENSTYKQAKVYVADLDKYKAADTWNTFTYLYVNQPYQLKYILDGEQDGDIENYNPGVKITPREEPTKEGHEFDGWKGLPKDNVMPANNVEVTGKFNYKLKYKLADGSVNPGKDLPEEEWLLFGDDVVISNNLECTGYIYEVKYYTETNIKDTLDIPENFTMPADNVVIYVNYLLSEQETLIDGINYKVVILPVGGVDPHAEVIASPNKTGAVDIPASISFEVGNEPKNYNVTIINDDAFNGKNSNNITSVTLYDGLKKIGARAFRDCRFTDLSIPATVESIGNGAFQYCRTMKSVDFNSNQNLTKLPDDAFQGCSSLGDVYIPLKVETIGNYAFQQCTSLENINFSEELKELKTIGNNAFQQCTNLASFELPEGLLSIGASAFASCSKSLETIKFPASVVEIGDNAFAGDTEIKTVIVTSTTLPTAYSTSFSDAIYGKAILKAPDEALVNLQEPWSNFAKDPGEEGQEGGSGTTKCATPTISYDKGKLIFATTTQGAQLVYTITDEDMTTRATNPNVDLKKKYNITVFAKKSGMLWSDEAKASITWHNGKPEFDKGFDKVELEESNLLKGDVNDDGQVTVTDAVEVVKLVVEPTSDPTSNE